MFAGLESPVTDASGPLAGLGRARNKLALAAGRARLHQGFARFAGKLGKDQIVGFAQQTGEIFFRQGILGFQGHPLRAGHVRCGNDAGAFGEVREILRGTFEGKPDFRRFQNGDGKNLSADPEGQIDTPGDLLGCVREGKAELADPVDIEVHGQECRGNLAKCEIF
jgi:hypothetical protein